MKLYKPNQGKQTTEDKIFEGKMHTATVGV